MRDMQEIQDEIDDIKLEIYYAEQADFLDWGNYHALKARLKELNAEMREVIKCQQK